MTSEAHQGGGVWAAYASCWDLLNTTEERFRAVAQVDPRREWTDAEVAEAWELIAALRRMFVLTRAEWTEKAVQEFEALGELVETWQDRVCPNAPVADYWLLGMGRVSGIKPGGVAPIVASNLIAALWIGPIGELVSALAANVRVVVCAWCGEVRPVKQERARYCSRRCMDGAKNARRRSAEKH